MKTLKFREQLIPLVLAGEKYVTWRFFDDKDIQAGDAVGLINWNTREQFGSAVITAVVEKPFSEITEADMEGHEKFSDFDEMKHVYQSYYPLDMVDEATVKMIHFKLL